MGLIIPIERIRKRMKKKEYIEREAFLDEKRKLYCENCKRRYGLKKGKSVVCYEIGDAPCRSCGIGDVLDDVEDFPAADVRHVVTCADCKYNTREVNDLFGNNAIQCITGLTHRHDWFCADGKKREES